jgi:hypothetical protein
MEKFNPVRLCAEEWADLMLEAGQKFLLITSKHHDGFCMWDAKTTDFKITNERLERDVIANNHHVLPLRGEDYQVWELDFPGENRNFEINTTEVGDKLKACWWNLNAGWSCQPWRHDVKSAERRSPGTWCSC